MQLQPSRLRIETIDAFNGWLANQLPIAAGAGSSLDVLTDARPVYEEAAQRALAHDLTIDSGLRWSACSNWTISAGAIWSSSSPICCPAVIDGCRCSPGGCKPPAPWMRRSLKLSAEAFRRRPSTAGESGAAARARCVRRRGGGRVWRRSSTARHSARKGRAPWRVASTPLRFDHSDVARWRSLADSLLTKPGRLRKKVDVPGISAAFRRQGGNGGALD